MLGLSRKVVYSPRIQTAKDEVAKELIKKVHLEHPAYGHRRVAIELGWSKNRARRIMVKYGLKPPRRKIKGFYLTQAVNNCPYTNLIGNLVINQPLQVLAGDLTYLRYRGSFLYLETAKDLFTKEILGLGLSDRHDHRLVMSTITQTVYPYHCPEYFHFDQGKENLAQPVISYLEDLGVKISVSDKASPWQNGSQESFFGRFKDEMGDLNRFDTLGELIEEIYAYIFYYNHKRIHTALKMPPIVFKQQFSDVESVSRKSGA